jgi:cytochrome c oxidase cbb3-type subunit III
MRRSVWPAFLTALLVAVTGYALSQEMQTGGESGVREQGNYQSMTPEQRAKATRAFLGLGAVPDKAAAARGEPLFKQNCAYCHGRQARGATAPSLITSDVVLSDDHGEHLVPFLQRGRPEKDMPSFATTPENQLRDIAEFLHLEVENVANRGTYRVLNILVGSALKGQAYVATHCMSCHTKATFTHIATRFRSPEQLQRGWVWPSRAANAGLAITASLKTPDGVTVTGRVTEISDFRITLIDSSGRTHVVDRDPGVHVEVRDPLSPHQQMLDALRNDDMHNVTAYLETLE